MYPNPQLIILFTVLEKTFNWQLPQKAQSLCSGIYALVPSNLHTTMKVQGVLCRFLVDPVLLLFWMQDMEHFLRNSAAKAQGSTELCLESLNAQVWYYIQYANMKTSWRLLVAQKIGKEHENFGLPSQKTEYAIWKPFVPLHSL